MWFKKLGRPKIMTVCTGYCGQTKPRSDFSRSRPDVCKVCAKMARKEKSKETDRIKKQRRRDRLREPQLELNRKKYDEAFAFFSAHGNGDKRYLAAHSLSFNPKNPDASVINLAAMNAQMDVHERFREYVKQGQEMPRCGCCGNIGLYGGPLVTSHGRSWCGLCAPEVLQTGRCSHAPGVVFFEVGT